jgi:alanine dehydrogenase
MTLLLNNEEIESVLSMGVCMEALETLYKEFGHETAGSFARQDLHVQTNSRNEYPDAPIAHYTKTMGGASSFFGVSAVRMSSDIVALPIINDKLRRVKIPAAPGGKYLGLILLYSSETGELLSIMNDGFLSRMRVGGTNGLAAKYLAREDAKVVGLFGSGWQAGAQLIALCQVRDIKKVRVFSPNRENREAFAKEMSKMLDLEVIPMEKPEGVVKDADILVTATNARQPFVLGEWIKPGMHISTLQRNELAEAAYHQIQHLVVNTHGIENNFTSRSLQEQYKDEGFEIKVHPISIDIDWGSIPTLGELAVGHIPGRESGSQITGFVNNLGHGAQFAAVGAMVYKLAKEKGLGRELSTEWFLQDIHP